ncbi:MAG: phenylalanine--tRNA ligase subunit beta [Nanoarchaeota archaeon]|nr:phenylalanine--tRNA ligase subunit beta [Nanoarchaeota archaeon]MBU1631912.1 phenylalanine--tRNA ligase subunit beta [Nanoarchaeota archaeon]MBU1875563.1 phenylalanine--tRNA ligase subunit beta [Nanoarchaeota archaeon]
MPTITLNKKIFEKLVGKELPLEELKDRISMLGTDLEKIEGNEIQVEIFPNRPDLLSEQGFARAFSSFIGVKTGLREYQLKKSGQKIIIENSVTDVRPYTACAIVKSLKFDNEKIKEIIQIQEKLHITFGRNRKKAAIGIYPMEKITFPVTYKADNPNKIKFQPLESEKEMTGLQILSQHKAGREFGHLLEGLDKFPFFIDAAGKILSMPPIINSHLTGRIDENTKDVFIECSGFDYNVLSKCLNIIVAALADMGGEIHSLELEYGKEKKISPNLIPERMKLDLGYINKRLGLSLPEKECIELLARMGYGYEKGEVLIPAYRTDILHQVDLVEDVAIAYGYENFEEDIPNIATIGEENPSEKFFRKVREILIGFGLLEVKNYHLMTKEELNYKMLLEKETVSLKNALGDYNHLRNSLLPSLMKNLSENQHNESPQNIFEIGRIFNLDKKFETGVCEKNMLTISLCHEKTDFTEIKQILDALMSSLGIEYSVKESKHPSYIDGRIGEIYVKSKNIGVIGEIDPQVIVNWNLAVPVVGLELNLEELFEFI